MKKMILAGLAAVALCASLMALDEAEVQTKMKGAGEAMSGLRKAMQAGSMPDVATHAKKMVESLDGVDSFWTGRSMGQAAKWQLEGLAAAKDLAKAAEAGNADAARSAMGKVGASCKQCHEAHREKIGENKYKIKP